jgi:hypothetical protein
LYLPCKCQGREGVGGGGGWRNCTIILLAKPFYPALRTTVTELYQEAVLPGGFRKVIHGEFIITELKQYLRYD